MHVDVSMIGIPLNGASRYGVAVGQLVEESLALRLRDGATIDDVLRHLEVPVGDVQFVIVNGHTHEGECRLCPGDSIALVGHLQGC